jgi:hypothetical protein
VEVRRLADPGGVDCGRGRALAGCGAGAEERQRNSRSGEMARARASTSKGRGRDREPVYIRGRQLLERSTFIGSAVAVKRTI